MDIRSYLIQHNMVCAGDLVMVAVSGGADSVCLLLALQELQGEFGYGLEAVHVEHGIRGEASCQDAQFVEELCMGKGIPVHIYSVDVPGYVAEHGGGLEEGARKLRYAAFAQAVREKMADGYAPEQIRIALAHHMQDQAETVLFRLVRGTGMAGLAGMGPVRRDMQGYFYIRPLLTTARDDVEAYLAQKNQAYCTDATNQEEDYARNRIRARVLPEFSQVNAQAVRHIAQTAELAAEQQDYIEVAARQELARIARWECSGQESGKHGRCVSGYGAGQKSARNLECEAEQKAVKGSAYPPAWSAEQEHEQTGFSESISLPIDEIIRLHLALQREILRQALCEVAGYRKDLTWGHVQQLMELTGKVSGSRISLPYGVEAEREFGWLVLRKRDTRGRMMAQKDDGQYEALDGMDALPEDTRTEPLEQVENRDIPPNRFGNHTERENLVISPEQIAQWKESGEDVRVRLSNSKGLMIRTRSDGLVLQFEVQSVGTAAQSEGAEAQSMRGGVIQPAGLAQCVENKKILSDFRKKTYTKTFNYDMIENGFTIRHRQPGDYFYMKDGHRKKLKKYLIEKRIPESARQKLWLVASGSQVLWVAGIRFPGA